jgi:hypothetical protein
MTLGMSGTTRFVWCCAAAIALDLSATSLRAQTPGDAAWAKATQQLSPGDEVRVTLDGGVSTRGRFRSASDRSIILDVAGRNEDVARERIRKLSIAAGTRQRRHEFIGMALGAAIGTWLWQRNCGDSQANCQEEAMLYFGAPMLGGGMLGHVLPPGTAWRDIYTRRD